MIYFFHIVLIILLSWSFQHYFLKGWKTPFYLSVGVKIVAGIALGLLYILYYKSGDTWVYHNEAVELMNLFYDDPKKYIQVLWQGNFENSAFPNQPRALFFIKITSTVALIAQGNYWIMSAYFSLASILCSWTFFVFAERRFGTAAVLPVLLMTCWPSVIFWTSGITKETVSLCAMLLIAVLLVLKKPTRLWQWLIALAFAYLLFNLKYYYAVLFFWAIIMVVLADRFENQLSNRRNQLLFILCAVIVMYLGTLLHPYLHLNRLVEVISHNYTLYADKSQPGEYLELPALNNSVLGVVKSIPASLLAGLFRPLPNDGQGILALLAGIENSVLLILVVSLVVKIRKLNISIYGAIILLYSLLLATFLAMSAPNFGSLVRYKMGFLPFLLLLILWNHPFIIWLQARVFKR